MTTIEITTNNKLSFSIVESMEIFWINSLKRVTIGRKCPFIKMIDTHTEGVCKLYFDCYISKTNTKADALAMLQKIVNAAQSQ
jgi:hypothetical protein